MLCCSGATPVTGAGKLLHLKSSAAQFEPSRQHRLNVGSNAPEILVMLRKGKGHSMTCICRHIGKAGYSSNPLASRCYKEVGGQNHAPAALPPGKNPYPL
jgi:hypothetical protein